jgi:hypothetical protein
MCPRILQKHRDLKRRELLRMAGGAGSGFVLPKIMAHGGPTNAATKSENIKFRVRRLSGNPIISAGMDQRLREEAEDYGYININGPSLIRAPEWVSNPLGKYYLYFAHHKGEYIRLAYADALSGPWKTYEPGALELSESHFPAKPPRPASALAAAVGVWKRNPPEAAGALTRVGLAARLAVAERKSAGSYGSSEDRPHIASPEVIVDEQNREIRMYYHGMLPDTVQMTRAAISQDGIHFQARPELLTSPYLRVFKYRDIYYGVGMPGILYRSADGISKFEARSRLLFGVKMRHVALMLRDAMLWMFFSLVGDAPERILCATMDISAEDWRQWRPSAPVEVLRPEHSWEGAELPVEPSIRGEITGPANQLRDPAIFEDEGEIYLLYSCAGEQAIAIAELEIDD